MPFAVGVGGERISRHNALRDAIFDTASQAGLAPIKEGRFLLPATLAQAATEPGYALTFAHQRKARGAEGDCRRQGIAFLPLVAESMGGWRASAEREIKKLGSALARHTGQLEGEAISHLWRRLGILLQRGNEGRGTPGKLGAYLPRTTHRWHN